MSGPKFKPGDRVRCVDDSNGGLLTTGRVYEVIDRAPTSGDDFLFVVANDGLEWDFLARRFVPADDPAPAPVLNPFEWDVDAYADAVNQTPPRSTYVLNIVAWARFCWWCTEHNIAARILPTRPATRTRASNGRDPVPATVTVELPRRRVDHIVQVGRVDAYDEVAVIDACCAALAGEA